MEAPQDPHVLDSLKSTHGGKPAHAGHASQFGRTAGGGGGSEGSKAEGGEVECGEVGLASRKAPFLSESRDDTRIEHARVLLASFARRTAIHAPGDAARRYLWTDAFAVQAMLALARATGESQHKADAFRLVELVHLHLGTHRLDDARVGWISGLDAPTGEKHPTLGGLRIGKPLPERAADAPYDGRLEWERDGQYYHYLTRWIEALCACARASARGEARERFLDSARELAHAMHASFVFEAWPGGPKRIQWKMSIDLTRPQVHASGLADMLDGMATFASLEAAFEAVFEEANMPDPVLARAIAELRAMCDAAGTFATVDPLALGGLLLDVSRLVHLAASGALARDLAYDRLVERLLVDIDRGLEAFDRSGALFTAIDRRLAFRELGLAIGLQSIGRLGATARCSTALVAAIAPRIDALARYIPLSERIERAWLEPSAQATEGWQSHVDINEVMLAACLLPEVVLESGVVATTGGGAAAEAGAGAGAIGGVGGGAGVEAGVGASVGAPR